MKIANWPFRSYIRDMQQSSHEKLDNLRDEQDGLLYVNGEVFIPDTAGDLKLKLMVVAHVGQSGHWGADTAVAILRQQFV